MKKIKSFYYEIVISKIYMLEKYKREFDEGNIYNGIWGTLQTFVVIYCHKFYLYSYTHLWYSAKSVSNWHRSCYFVSNSGSFNYEKA